MHFQVGFGKEAIILVKKQMQVKLSKYGRSNKRLYLDYTTPTSNLFYDTKATVMISPTSTLKYFVIGHML